MESLGQSLLSFMDLWTGWTVGLRVCVWTCESLGQSPVDLWTGWTVGLRMHVWTCGQSLLSSVDLWTGWTLGLRVIARGHMESLKSFSH